jgi:hypothetical protein
MKYNLSFSHPSSSIAKQHHGCVIVIEDYINDGYCWVDNHGSPPMTFDDAMVCVIDSNNELTLFCNSDTLHLLLEDVTNRGFVNVVIMGEKR